MVTRRFAFVCLLLTGCMAATQDATTSARTIDPVDDAEVELTLVQEGTTFKLYRGGIYRVNERSGRWDFVAEGYDPDYYDKNYMEKDGAIFRKGDNGTLYRVGQEFSDDFENAKTIRDLIGVERGWTSFTLQSPRTPTVEDYVRLRKRILAGQADFLDNRIKPSGEVVHAGQTALKACSVPRSGDMVTSKASISTELIHFVRGDDVWFAGWYYVPTGSAMPFTLMDLETTWFKEHPGIRIMAFGDKHLGVELKWVRQADVPAVERERNCLSPGAMGTCEIPHHAVGDGGRRGGTLAGWNQDRRRSRPNPSVGPHHLQQLRGRDQRSQFRPTAVDALCGRRIDFRPIAELAQHRASVAATHT